MKHMDKERDLAERHETGPHPPASGGSLPLPQGERGIRRDVVVFDLGGVLIDWNPRHLYRKIFEDAAEMERFLGEICTQDWNEEQDAGRPFAEAVAMLQARHPAEAERIAAFDLRWEEMIKGPIEETVAVLEELHAAGTPLYALTNWSAEKFPVARQRFSFLAHFRGILVSGEVGVIKPDPRIFEMLIERFAIDPYRAVYIDDVEANVVAARPFGIHAIQFTTPAALRSELAALELLPAP
jgi:2-haloacid dehalogenase